MAISDAFPGGDRRRPRSSCRRRPSRSAVRRGAADFRPRRWRPASCRADRRAGQPGRHGRGRLVGLSGTAATAAPRTLRPCAATSCRTPSARVRRRPWSPATTAGEHRLQPAAGRQPAVGLRLRARAGVPAAAGVVPLGRRRGHRRGAQPAVGRGRLRDAGVRLPVRPLRVDAGLHAGRRHHQLDAAVPVRHPVRPVDGLPRLRAEPDPRGPRPRPADPAGGGRRASAARPG